MFAQGDTIGLLVDIATVDLVRRAFAVGQSLRRELIGFAGESFGGEQSPRLEAALPVDDEFKDLHSWLRSIGRGISWCGISFRLGLVQWRGIVLSYKKLII